VAFAQAGQRVVLADLDLGASNLHLVLGHQSPKTGIGTFLNDTRSDFNAVIADTDVRGLRFIPGDTEIPGTANLKPYQLKALVRRFLALKEDADILILDLGAGTHQSILDFFLLSGQGIVVSAPMVTAVLNAYVFLKKKRQCSINIIIGNAAYYKIMIRAGQSLPAISNIFQPLDGVCFKLKYRGIFPQFFFVNFIYG